MNMSMSTSAALRWTLGVQRLPAPYLGNIRMGELDEHVLERGAALS